jgi:hypothetical protein
VALREFVLRLGLASSGWDGHLGGPGVPGRCQRVAWDGKGSCGGGPVAGLRFSVLSAIGPVGMGIPPLVSGAVATHPVRRTRRMPRRPEFPAMT